ncbi:hypothetical protein BMS3Abin04_00170 [bacterium BMS3Abin04]|nr:hypothetical protein BMS3Abin04_00170 [bacterium BMS3Abin04]
MVKKTSRKIVEKSKATSFRKVAENFYEGDKVAYDFEYFNASGVLIVHAAIAFADAVTIELSGWKCSGENHYEIISLLTDITPPNKYKNNAINHFRKIIGHKNLISYSGDEYHKKDIDKLWKHLERFIIWINTILD